MQKARHLSELNVRDLALLDEEYIRVRHCALCGEDYKALHNLGRLCCRVHPGVLCIGNRGHYVYSCCSRGDDSPGCVRCDHIDTMPATDDEATRHADLVELLGIRVVPVVLFQYGVTRPLTEAVLARSSGGGDDDVRIGYTLPFESLAPTAAPQTLGEMARTLSATVPQSPLLTQLYGTDDRSAERRALMQSINDRWPETCAKQEDGPVINGRGGGGGGASSGNSDISAPVQYIVPFLVICRIKR